jgi:2-polyprenyl-3-methyl-5-hydroxy-6-metoxy-1,4-benzoquinol methylase
MAFHQRILAPEWVNALYSEWIDDSQIDAFRAQNVDGNQVQARFEDARQMVKHVLRLQKLVGENAAARLRLLDYGCGDGKFLQFAALFGFEAYGIDFSATRVRRAGQAGLTIVGGLEEFDAAAPGKLHAVTLFQVLEHLVEPVQMLRQLADRLVEGGVLVVEVPDCRGITRPTNFEQFHAVHPLEHINAFTPLTLKQMCERLGFVSIPRHAAHVTTSVIDLLKTEISRVVQPSRTAQYFRKL